MPRDLSMYIPRLRSPPISMSRSSSQVSMTEEMSDIGCSSVRPPEVRLVISAVICCILRKSISRISMAFDFGAGADGEEAGDRIDHHHPRRKLLHQLVDHRQVHLQAIHHRARGLDAQQPLLDPRRQIDADRAHVAHELAGDSSKAR